MHFPLALPWNSFSQKSSEVTGETSHQNLPFLLSPAVCPSNQPHTGSINSRVKGRDTLPCSQQESSEERLVFKGYEIKLLSSSLSDEPRVLGKSLCWVWDGLDWIDFTLLTKPLVVWMVKNLPTMQETRVWSLGQEDPLEEEMITHSSILAWRISWTEEPGRLQSMGLQRVGHHWMTNTYTHIHIGVILSPMLTDDTRLLGQRRITLLLIIQWAARFASFPSCLEFLSWWNNMDPGGWFVGSSCRWGTLSLGNLPSHREIKSYIFQRYSLQTQPWDMA